MTMWEQLAEARIREWLNRPAAEREGTAMALEPGLPLELQLMQDVLQLDRLAAATDDVTQAESMKRRAAELMMRLTIILEDQGRPLAAQHFAERRQAARHEQP